MSNTVKVVIWGAGGHALVVANIVRQSPGFEVYGFLVDEEYRSAIGQEFRDSIVGGPDMIPMLLERGVLNAIVAVGNCHARQRLSKRLKNDGFVLATAIHPRAIIAPDVVIGQGTVVAAGAVINPGACIGQDVIINTSAVVEHHCKIDDGVHIAPGALLGGNVTIGRTSWVGIGAVVIENVKVGNNSFLGAGSVVVNDIPDNVVAYGVPAREKRRNAGAQG